MHRTQEVESHLAGLIRPYRVDQSTPYSTRIVGENELERVALTRLGAKGSISTAQTPSVQQPETLIMGTKYSQEQILAQLKKPEITIISILFPEIAAKIIETNTQSPCGIQIAEVIRRIQDKYPEIARIFTLREGSANVKSPDGPELDITAVPGGLSIKAGNNFLNIEEPINTSQTHNNLQMYVKDEKGNSCRINYLGNQKGTKIKISHNHSGDILHLEILRSPDGEYTFSAKSGGKDLKRDEFLHQFPTAKDGKIPSIIDIVDLLILQGEPVTILLEKMGITR